jgi:hypothetical protein
MVNLREVSIKDYNWNPLSNSSKLPTKTGTAQQSQTFTRRPKQQLILRRYVNIHYGLGPHDMRGLKNAGKTQDFMPILKKIT